MIYSVFNVINTTKTISRRRTKNTERPLGFGTLPSRPDGDASTRRPARKPKVYNKITPPVVPDSLRGVPGFYAKSRVSKVSWQKSRNESVQCTRMAGSYPTSKRKPRITRTAAVRVFERRRLSGNNYHRTTTTAFFCSPTGAETYLEGGGRRILQGPGPYNFRDVTFF